MAAARSTWFAAADQSRRSSSRPRWAKTTPTGCLSPSVLRRVAPAACVYDRVGTGRASKPSPAVAAADHVRQLHEMLELAEVPRPVILVGHSYGGLVALMATVTYPEDVAGLVLVDSSHPHQVQRFRLRSGARWRTTSPRNMPSR